MLYANLPYSHHKILFAISETIKVYEPRLKEVIVEKIMTHEQGLLTISIRGHLSNQQSLAFNSYFSTAGVLELESA